MSKFERVYLRDDGVSLRVAVTETPNGWEYDLPGVFRHECESRECSLVDRMAIDRLTSV